MLEAVSTTASMLRVFSFLRPLSVFSISRITDGLAYQRPCRCTCQRHRRHRGWGALPLGCSESAGRLLSEDYQALVWTHALQVPLCGRGCTPNLERLGSRNLEGSDLARVEFAISVRDEASSQAQRDVRPRAQKCHRTGAPGQQTPGPLLFRLTRQPSAECTRRQF
jgi:hypothetical protein